MALLLDPVEARLDAILTAARGSAMSAHAQALAIPVGWFRKVPHGASVRDAALELGAFDRGYSLDWVSIGDDPDPANGYDTTSLRVARLELVVGYLYGDDATDFVHRAPSTSEAGSVSVRVARARALSDAERIYRALSFTEMVTGDDIDPSIVGVWREGLSALEDLGGGRLVCATPYRLLLNVTTAGSYSP